MMIHIAGDEHGKSKNTCNIGLKQFQFQFNNAKANTDKIGPQYINKN